ncbi:MAG: Gfo/Idh/MocA family oxidoreductase [Chloroflexi bacterium]|nr:Gfo/Idh/MocA family oxidoreductase [Chloroflexota bacterium]
MKDKVKLGIAGCGFAGTQTMYAPILRLLEKGRVTALMDPDQGALDFLTQNYGDFDCYDDYGEFLAKADIDAVLVASPVYLHEEQVIQAAQAGKHILCEKPMAPTIEACDRMRQAARMHNVTLMIGFVKRFDKSLQLAHDLIQDGRLGKLFHIRAEVSWCHDLSPLGFNWRQSLRALGGVFQDNASHIVDLCRWWAGEVRSVSGHAMILRPDWEVETQAHATLRHENGVVSTIHVSNVSQKPMTEYFLLEGSEAALELHFGPAMKYSSAEPFSVRLWEGGQKQTDLTLYSYGNLDRELCEHGPYKRQVEHFCESILESKAPWIDGLTGRKAIEVVNGLYLASWQDRTIKLPLSASGDLEQFFRGMRMQYGG